MSATAAQLASVAFCKTTKWLFLVQDSGSLLYATNDDAIRLRGATKMTADEIVQAQSVLPDRRWAIHALTEPALPEEACDKVLDFLYPSSGDRIAKAVTPSRLLSTLISYFDRAASMVGRSMRYRGLPDLGPSTTNRLNSSATVNVCPNGMLLSSERIEISKAIEVNHDVTDKHLWYNRALMELLPCGYYQSLIGSGGGYIHYVVAALDGIQAAESVWDEEITALREHCQREGTDSRFLSRVVAPAAPVYKDLFGDGNDLQVQRSLEDLDKKLIILSNSPRTNSYSEIDLDEAPTRRAIVRLHLGDALAPITTNAWGAL